MPIEKIAKANGKFSYKAQLFLGRCPNTGKKLRVFKNFSTLKAAKEWLEKEQARASKQKSTDETLSLRKKILLVHIQSYLEKVHRDSSDNTFLSYRQCINKWISPYWGHLVPDHVSKMSVDNFKKYLSENSCSDRNTSFVLGRLKAFFDYLEVEEIIMKNPLNGQKIGGKFMSVKTQRVKYHDNKEIETILNRSDRHHYTDFIEFLYFTGLRIGEACAVRPSDYDKRTRTLSVAYQLQKYVPKKGELEVAGAFELKATKGLERRVVVLVPHIATKIERIIRNIGFNEFIFRPLRPRVRPVIMERGTSKLGVYELDFINPYEFSNDVYVPYQKRAKISNVLSVHATRHSFAVSFMRNGGDIVVLSKLLGHKSIEVTKVYLEFSPSYLSEFEKYVDFSTQSGVHQVSTKLRVVKKKA